MKKSARVPPRSIAVRVLHPWKTLTKEETRRECILHTGRHGGLAMTLNLKPEFEDLLNSKSDPMREVSKRMNAELGRRDQRQLPYLLVLEATKPDGRLHLHGVFLDQGRSRVMIQTAMRKAVGYIFGRSGSRQFKATFVYAAVGWHTYLGKDQTWTRKLLDLDSSDHLWLVSQPMTQIVRADYETTRLGLKTPANTFLLSTQAK
jgi:hypothetical protein